MADKPEGPGPSKPVDPKAAEDLAKAMQNTKAAAAAVTASFEQQLKVILQLRDAMASMSSNMEKMGQQTAGALSPDKWDEVSKKVQKTNTATKGATGAVAKMAEVMQSKWTKAALVAQGALSGLYQGFKNLFSLTKAATGFFGGVVKGLFNVGKAAIAIPFKMMSGLFKMASQGGGGTELAQAYENVRAAFGDLKGDVPQTIIGVSKSFDSMNQTGVSTTAIFGNMAQRLEAVNKLAQEMGPTFFGIEAEFKKNGVAMMTYQKGMGLTGEQMASVAQAANRMGTSSTKVLNDMAKQSLAMAKNFGIPAKVISKDMGKAMQDLAHFGHLSTKEIAVAATFANKLGVSVDKLTGIMDATSTFDQAAEGMSKLNQQFGTNIDATQIMMAQTHVEKVEMLRKEFARTGKDMSKLTVQERMLIKQSSGLDDAMMDAAFSAKNAGVSLDKISKVGDKSEKKTLSQAEAMQEMGKSIERAVVAGEKFASMFEAIISGIKKGIMSSPEFVALMQNINVIMQKAFFFGMKLGKMFVDLFPGVKDVFGGLKEMFSPERFQKMFDGVLKAFDVFKVGGSGKMEDFMDQIQKVFLQFFSAGEPGGKKVLEGFKKFGGAVAQVFGMMSKWVIDKLSTIVDGITNWLKDPKIPSANSGGLAGSLFGPFEGALKSLKEKLLPALKRLVSQLWDMLVESIKGMSTKTKLMIGGAIATIILGPAIGQAIIGLASSNLFSSFGKDLGGMLDTVLESGISTAASAATKSAKGIFTDMGGKLGGSVLKMGESLGPKMTKAIPVVGWAIAIADAAINVSESTKKFGEKLEKEGFDPATSKIAAGSTGLINALTLGLLPDDLQSKIATAIAKIADSLFKSVDKWFGPGFSDTVKKYMGGVFDVFGGIGDLLLSMWKGDSKGVNESLKKIGKGLMDMLLGQLEMAANVLLKIGPMILEYFYKALGWLSSKIGDVFLSLKDIPVVGFIFDWIGQGFKLLGDFFNKAGEAWSKIGDIMKSLNITQMLRGWGNAIVEFATNAWKKFTWLVDVLTLPFRIMFNLAKTIFQALWQEVLSPVVDFVVKWGGMLLNVLLWPFKKMWEFIKMQASTIWNDFVMPIWNLISKAGSMILDVLKTPFVLAWNEIKAVVGFLWDTFWGLIEKFKTWGHQVLDILTDPHKKAWDKIKELLGLLWDSFKALPGKLIVWGVELLGVLTKPFKETWDWVKQTFSFDKFKELGQSIIDGITAPLKTAKDLITKPFSSAVDGVKNFLGIHSPSTVFADMGGNMIDGMMAPMKKLPLKIKEAFLGVIKNVKEAFEAIADKVEALVTSMMKKFIIIVEKGIEMVIQTVMTIAPKIMKAVEKVVPIVDDIFTLVVASVRKNFNLVFGVVQEITNKVLSFLEKSMPRGVKIFKDFKDSIFEIFGLDGFIKLFENIVEGVKKALGKLADTGPFKAIIAIAKKVFKIESPSKVFEDIGDNIAAGMNSALSQIPENASKTFKKTVQGAKDMQADMAKSKRPSPLVGAAPSVGITKLSTSGVVASAENIGDALHAVQDMVQKTRDLDAALSSLPKFRFPAKLHTIANGMGLGGKFSYTVQSKEVVINMHIDISMDVDKVEKVMITRHNSIIRDRINFGLENSSQKGKTDAYIKKTGDQGTNQATYNQ